MTAPLVLAPSIPPIAPVATVDRSQEKKERVRARVWGVGALPAFLAVLTLVIGADMNDRRWALVLMTGGSLALGTIGIRVFQRMFPESIVPKVALIAATLQILWLFLLAFFDFDTRVPSTDLPVDLRDFPVLASVPMLLAPAGMLLAGVLVFGLRRFTGRRTRAAEQEALSNTDETLPGDPKTLTVLLVVLAVLQVMVWVPGAGVLHVLAAVFSLTPFMAGRYARNLKIAHRVWMVALAISFVLGVVASARSLAFFPAGFYAIGYWTSLPQAKKARYAVLFGALFIPVLYLSAQIGELRTRIGRGGLDSFSAERVELIVQTIMTPRSDGSQAEVVGAEGFGRLLTWPNNAVAILSPDVVPLRGVDSVVTELGTYTQIPFLTGRTREEIVDSAEFSEFGLLAANRYGFLVDGSTAVDFGLLADGWSRTGPSGPFVFGFVLMLFLIGLETFHMRQLRASHYEVYMLLMLVLASAASKVATRPFLFLVREVVLGTGLILVLAAFVIMIRGTLRLRD